MYQIYVGLATLTIREDLSSCWRHFYVWLPCEFFGR